MAAVIFAGMVFAGYLTRDTTLLGQVPLENSPPTMTDRARQFLSRLGFTERPFDSAGWYEVDRGVRNELATPAGTTDRQGQVWIPR